MNWGAIKHLAGLPPQRLLRDLLGWRLTESDIAREIGVTQGRVNQVRNDPKAGFRGQATVKLMQLHASMCPQQAAA